jgi:hypothetical protein
LGSEPSINISNPIDLFNNYTDGTYINIQKYSLPEHRNLRPPCLQQPMIHHGCLDEIWAPQMMLIPVEKSNAI